MRMAGMPFISRYHSVSSQLCHRPVVCAPYLLQRNMRVLISDLKSANQRMWASCLTCSRPAVSSANYGSAKPTPIAITAGPSTPTAGAAALPGIVSDEFVRQYAELAFGMMPSFTDSSLTAHCAARPSCDRSARRSRARRNWHSRSQLTVAEPRGRLGLARANAARCRQPPHRVPAHGVPCRQQAHATACPQVRRRVELRFLQCGGRGRAIASHAALLRA